MSSSHSVYRPALNRNRLVHIVDDDLARCEMLGVLFRLEGFQTTFSIALDEFLRNLELRPPQVVIMNLEFKGESTLPMLRRIKSLRSGIIAVMTSQKQDVGSAVQAMRFGAADVLTLPLDKEHLLDIVRDGLRKDVHMGVMEGGQRSIEIRGFSELTPREREVLQMITDGHSNKTAARELDISSRTVEVHRARVMEKLGARNAAELIRIVLTR
ncbi:MAG: hypothetical protein ABS75_09445 [Pelagibacterium sp. SCN 63-23]|nr:MAG: hypothetical protein ABS75_09445 [Pelagibacterium sp. SCN 63-23]